MNNMFTALVLFATLASGVAAASESRDGALPGTAWPASSRQSSPLTLTPVQHHPHTHFLGCVHSQHQCTHVAHSRGFHHHGIRHDHHACPHHPHFACFGW